MRDADARRLGDRAVLRLKLDEAADHYRSDEDLQRLCRLGVLLGRHRVVTRLRHHLRDGEYRAFLRERALPQVPIGGDARRGFAVDEAMIGEIAAALDEPASSLLAEVVRRLLASGSLHVAKLYVLARLSGDEALVREVAPAFEVRAAWPRARLPDEVGRIYPTPLEVLQVGDDDDYNPKSAHLFQGAAVVVKEHLRLHLDPARLGLDGYSDEGGILRASAHPHVARLLDVVTVRRHELLVLARAPGVTLDGTRLPRAEALRVVRQLAETLAWLHARSILYLDVKPQNVVFDGERVTLCDFGMARRSAGPVTSMLSTLEYVPPEMARGFTSTAASDVFQLGIVSCQLLAGRHPFSSGEGVDVALANLWDEPDLEGLGPARPLVAQMLAKRPEERPSAAEAQAELLRWS